MTCIPVHVQSDHIVLVINMLVMFTSLSIVDVADFQSFHRYCYHFCFLLLLRLTSTNP